MTRDRLTAALEVLKGQTKRDKPLSLRLSAEEQRRLYRVAKAERIPPATLARVLIMAGVEDLEARGKG